MKLLELRELMSLTLPGRRMNLFGGLFLYQQEKCPELEPKMKLIPSVVCYNIKCVNP